MIKNCYQLNIAMMIHR